MSETVAKLTTAERLEAARTAERSARARVAQLRRALRADDRRTETMRLCVLGRSLNELCLRDADVHARVVAFLRDYVTRPSDRAALHGTQFDLDRAATDE